jgi:hypothetical protein
VFCKPGDYPRILACFRHRGYTVEIEDERWIGKIKKDDCFVDVIFNSTIAVLAPRLSDRRWRVGLR